MRSSFFFVVMLLSVVIAGCNCGSAGVGNFCQQDADCETGVCHVGAGPGYCTAPCSVEGNISECPADTVCKPIHGGPRRCLLICSDGDACPAGSSCVSVANTDAKACEPR